MARYITLFVCVMLPTTSVFAHSGCACSADVDGSGTVDGGDYDQLVACLGHSPTTSCEGADIDCDGDIDNGDVDVWFCRDATRVAFHR